LTFRMDEKGDRFFQTAMWSSAGGSASGLARSGWTW